MNSFLNKSLKRAPSRPTYAVPDGLRVYAIGDVHGCLDEMCRVLKEIERDVAKRSVRSHLIFLGDLVDRGPNSAGVIERLLEEPLPGDEASFLMGNHEEAMLAAYDGDTRSYGGWLQNGGIATLKSYGLTESTIFRRSFNLSEALRTAVPAAHVDFLRSFREHVRIGDYVFVHAGIRPGLPLEQQTGRDLRWIREGFLDSREDHGFLVVHGHTIVPQVVKKPNRIAVDTGCYLSGQLSVVALEGDLVEVLSTPKRRQKSGEVQKI